MDAGSPRVLDAMSGTGVRALRYAHEAGASVHANDLLRGDHPLCANLAALEAAGRCRVTAESAVDLYLRARLENDRYDLVDCDAFGTGQPHAAEAWWAVRRGGLLYLCATDSCTTCGHNPHQAAAGYAAVAGSIKGSQCEVHAAACARVLGLDGAPWLADLLSGMFVKKRDW